jgi:hypothetical protein
MKYLVEIIPESITDFGAATSRLASTLKLEPAKAAALLKRNPVTKPVSQAEAEKVARLFTRAGIEVFVRSEDESPTPPLQTNLTHEPTPATPEEKVVPISTTRPTFDRPESSTVEPPAPVIHTPDINLKSVSHFESEATNIEAARMPSVVPEIDHASSLPTNPPSAPSFEGSHSFDTPHTDEFKLPSGFFTPVPAPDNPSLSGSAITTSAATTSPATTSSVTSSSIEPVGPAQGSLGKLLFASIVPGLLGLAGVFTALYLLGPPLLRSEQRTPTVTTAVSLASSIGAWIGDVSLDNPALSQQLQNVTESTRIGLQERGIDFVLLTDLEGNQLTGWYKDSLGVPDTITNTDVVRNQVSTALGEAVASDTGTPLGSGDPNTRLTLDGETLELASQVVRQGTTPVGTVVVGRSDQPLTSRSQSLLTTLALAGGLPFLLGILISMLIGRSRT